MADRRGCDVFFLLSDSLFSSDMGCDGGTIPTRDELVKLKKKPEQKDADAVRLLKWAHCALSQQVCALSRPQRWSIFQGDGMVNVFF